MRRKARQANENTDTYTDKQKSKGGEKTTEKCREKRALGTYRAKRNSGSNKIKCEKERQTNDSRDTDTDKERKH